MEHIKNRINGISSLPPEEMNLLLTIVKRQTLPKGAYILRKGAICRHLYFVLTGGVRCFYIRGEKEITEWITMDDSFFYPPISLFRQQPGRLNIQTMETTELYSIELKALDKLCAVSHPIERFFRHLLMDGILAGERRIESLLTGTARERYINLSTRYPDIIQRVPLSYIASYIGVTPETLSRIRSRKNVI